MIYRLIAGATVFILAGLAYWRWKVAVNRQAAEFFDLFISAFVTPDFYKIVMSFCAEAAVLIAVFPILDRLFGPTGVGKITWKLVVGSEGLALILLMAAGILSAVAGRQGQRER